MKKAYKIAICVLCAHASNAQANYFESFDQTINTLSGAVDVLVTEYEKTTQNIFDVENGAKNQLQAKDRELNQALEQRKQAQAALQAKDAELEKMKQAQEQALDKKNAELKQMKQKLNQKDESIRGELVVLMNMAHEEGYEQALNQWRTEQDRANIVQKELDKKNAELNQELEKMKQAQEQAQGELKQAQGAEAALQAKEAELEKMKQALKQMKQEYEQELKATKASLQAEQKHTFEEVQREVDEKLNQAQRELDEKEAELEKMKQALKQMKQEYEQELDKNAQEWGEWGKYTQALELELKKMKEEKEQAQRGFFPLDSSSDDQGENSFSLEARERFPLSSLLPSSTKDVDQNNYRSNQNAHEQAELYRQSLKRRFSLSDENEEDILSSSYSLSSSDDSDLQDELPKKREKESRVGNFGRDTSPSRKRSKTVSPSSRERVKGL